MSVPASAQPTDGRLKYTVAAVALLLTGAALHFVYLVWNCPLDLSGDEAHYWEWSRRLAWSYYSKGPLVAWIIAAGREVFGDFSRQLLGNEVLTIRVPAMLLSLGTGLGIYVLARRTVRDARLALAAVAMTFTVPVLAVGATLLTIDAPLAFLFVWTLIAVEHGLRTARTWPWLVAGVLIALGILAKYTMVLVFPVIGLALLLEPTYRAVLRRPGPYLGTLVAALGFVPILLWNAQHDWVSFRHVAGQAGVATGPKFHVTWPLLMIGGQLLVAGPVWFAGMVAAVVHLLRSRTRDPAENTPGLSLLISAALVPWLVFLAFSPLTKVQPNWPVLAIFPGIILLVTWLRRLWRSERWGKLARRMVAVGAIWGGVCVLAMHYSQWLYPLLGLAAGTKPAWVLTPMEDIDPAARLRGWSQLGAAVGRVLSQERAAGREPFIVADHYQLASEVAFYCPGNPEVYCIQVALGERQSQYDIWPNPIRDAERFVGRPCIYVGALKAELTKPSGEHPPVLRNARAAEQVRHVVRGHVVRLWTIFVCDEFTGFPAEMRGRAGKY